MITILGTIFATLTGIRAYKIKNKADLGNLIGFGLLFSLTICLGIISGISDEISFFELEHKFVMGLVGILAPMDIAYRFCEAKEEHDYEFVAWYGGIFVVLLLLLCIFSPLAFSTLLYACAIIATWIIVGISFLFSLA